MNCHNCGIKVTNQYVRAGKIGTVYCSEACSYEAYKGFYTNDEVDKTIEIHTLAEEVIY